MRDVGGPIPRGSSERATSRISKHGMDSMREHLGGFISRGEVNLAPNSLVAGESMHHAKEVSLDLHGIVADAQGQEAQTAQIDTNETRLYESA